jgi:phosphomannomutase/phosphoglucomutase
MGFTQKEETKLEEIYASKNFKVASWDALGKETRIENAVDEHIKVLLEMCDADAIRSKSFRVIVDPGNGAACVHTPYLMQRLNCQVVTINGQLDGHFPGRRSEPDEDSLGDLIQMVKKTEADLGIAHDGDSDRVVFVTEQGEVIRGDRTIALLAKQAIGTSKDKTVVTTVDSSLVLDETVEKAGGNTIRTPVGDIQVAIKVVESKGVIGGEACGVYIFPDAHLAPEPFLAACKVLELMASTGKSFGNLIAAIPQYPLLKGKIECPNDKKQIVMDALAKALPSKMTDVKEVLTVDGLGVTLKQGWVLVRPSGTEPVIRITCEGPTEDVVKRITEPPIFILKYGVNLMPGEKEELEAEIMDEFEWALKDPNEVKIRQLGEVVSIITTKLTEAITNLQISVMDLESKVSAMESRMSSMSARAPAAAADPAAGGEPIPTMAKAPTPKPAPAGAPGGGMSMMGELKALLAARRRKADG